MQTIEFQRHTPAMDLFALGVILFIMLTGQKPMTTVQASELSYSSFEAHEYPRMTSKAWTRLSEPARDLVLRMLERIPTKRITAAEVTHPCWACCTSIFH
jgi:serine/threonine protein kinase